MLKPLAEPTASSARPRTMFACQIVATVIAGLVQLGVQSWMFESIPDMCDPHQKDHFTCTSTEVFYTASVIWGVVGPNLLFSPGQVYSFLRFFFLLGAIAPMCVYNKRRTLQPSLIVCTASRGSWRRDIPTVISDMLSEFVTKHLHALLVHRPSSFTSIPVIVNGTGWIPPASALNYVPWAIVGFVTQHVVRRRHFGWWSKYNCEFITQRPRLAHMRTHLRVRA